VPGSVVTAGKLSNSNPTQTVTRSVLISVDVGEVVKVQMATSSIGFGIAGNSEFGTTPPSATLVIIRIA
jgi:hypothetical protein